MNSLSLVVNNPYPVSGAHDEQGMTPKAASVSPGSSGTVSKKIFTDEDDEWGLLSYSEEESPITTRVTRSFAK